MCEVQRMPHGRPLPDALVHEQLRDLPQLQALLPLSCRDGSRGGGRQTDPLELGYGNSQLTVRVTQARGAESIAPSFLGVTSGGPIPRCQWLSLSFEVFSGVNRALLATRSDRLLGHAALLVNLAALWRAARVRTRANNSV